LFSNRHVVPPPLQPQMFTRHSPFVFKARSTVAVAT